MPLKKTSFSKKPFAKGDVQFTRTRMLMNLDLDVAGRSFHTKVEGSERKERTILKADAEGVVTDMKVHYLEARKASITQGKTERETEPVEGKTYRLRRRGDETVITYPDGGTPPRDELDAVEKDYRRFGEPDRVFASLPTRPLSPGERVPELEKSLEKTFADTALEQPKGTVERVEVTFAGPKGKLGVFDVEVVLAINKSPLEMRFPLKGKLELYLSNGWLHELEMAGPVEVAASKGGGPPITGGGTMKMTSSATYP